MTSIIMALNGSESIITATSPSELVASSHHDPQLESAARDVMFNTLSANDQDMIVNVTREYPFDYAMVMFGYIMPFVLVLTLATNTLVVIVLAQKHMRTPTNIVLFTMAIVDLMTLLSPSPWYFYIYTLGYHDKFLYPPTACYAHHIMTDVIPVFFHTSSIWLALLLASQRYIYVCHPTLARTWCTVPRVRRAIVIILVTAFLHQLTKFFDNNFVAVTILVDETPQPACKIEIADWVHSIDIAFYYTTYFTFRILFVFIIPCTALITLNYLLFRALRRAESKRTELLKTRFKLIRNSRLINEIAPRDSSLNSNIIANQTNDRCNRRSSKRKRRTNMCNKATEQLNGTYTAIEQSQARPLCRTSNGSRKIIKQQSVDCENQLVGVSTSCCAKTNEKSTDDAQASSQLNTGDSSTGLNNARKSDEDDEDEIGEPNNNNNNDDHNNDVAQEDISESGAGRDHDDDEEEDDDDDDDDDNVHEDEDESTCPECANYKGHDMDCRRCSAGSVDGATTTCDRGENYHHGFSQCSSLIGGATNTTTNEDMSSCAVTHHASSSIFVTQDGAADPMENGSARGECMEQENLSLNNPDCSTKLGSDLLQASDEAKLTKSGSVDSRLVCGCLPSARTKHTKDFRALRSIRRTANMYRESCLSGAGCRQLRANRKHPFMRSYKDQSKKRSSPCCRDDQSESKCLRQCSSSSDPCMNCHNNLDRCVLEDRSPGNGRADDDPFLCNATASTRTTANKYSRKCCLGAGVGSKETETEADNRSDVADKTGGCHERGEEQSKELSSNRMFSSHDRVPTTTTTATTTTTNLYSANTNSSGSLPQALSISAVGGANQQCTGALANTNGTHSSSNRAAKGVFQMPIISQTKSPSYTGSISGCAGNRANMSATTTTHGGSSGGGGHAAIATTTTASVRTMDSNRTTLMLIVVVTVFLMVEVPVAIVTILHVVLNTFDVFKDVDFGLSLNYTKLLTNFFIMISYSVNFTIYCSMSKKFRDTFRDLFLCKKYKSSLDMRANQSMLGQQSQYNPPNFNISLPSECNAHLFGGRRATVTQCNEHAPALGNNCKGSFSKRAGRASTSAIVSETTLNLHRQHEPKRKRCEL